MYFNRSASVTRFSLKASWGEIVHHFAFYFFSANKTYIFNIEIKDQLRYSLVYTKTSHFKKCLSNLMDSIIRRLAHSSSFLKISISSVVYRLPFDIDVIGFFRFFTCSARTSSLGFAPPNTDCFCSVSASALTGSCTDRGSSLSRGLAAASSKMRKYE